VKALDLIKETRGTCGTRARLLRCKETGEVHTTTEWAKAIADKTGVGFDCVRQAICRAIRVQDGKYRGITFENMGVR
jgi:hypothetical protein